MEICYHYDFDREANRYVSLIEKYLPYNNSKTKHFFICKRCGMKLHDIDLYNLNNKLNDLNNEIDGNNKNFPLLDLSDIHFMLAPVPDAYHEDDKYRPNQIR
jgi:hypothetical protein